MFRTLDDLVDDGVPGPPARVAAVARWAAGREGPRTREVAVLEDLASRHPLPRDAFADFCAGMRHDLERRPLRTEADVDATASRSPARSAW